MRWLATRVQLPVEGVDPNTPFADYGLDSLMAVQLVDDLKTWLGERIDLVYTAVWSYPTIAELAFHLSDQLAVSKAILGTLEQRGNSRSNGRGYTPSMDELETLSDLEIARLFAQEVADVRKAIGHESLVQGT